MKELKEKLENIDEPDFQNTITLGVSFRDGFNARENIQRQKNELE